MIANYHTHTYRCRHATDKEEDYVNRAVENGIQIMGFSDHTPYWFPGDYYSTYRMFPEQLDDYCATVQALKARFAGKMQIHLGVEVEYYPAYFGELMARLRDTPVEYMLLGQHFIGNEIGEPYTYAPTEDEDVLRRYCDQVVDGLYTGLFTYAAHPDLILFTGDDKVYRKHMKRICQAANACGLPLEINFVGIRGKRNYPNERFWQVAAEEGSTVIFGCDAHRAVDAFDPVSEQTALEIVSKYGLKLVHTVPLRPIR